MWVEAFFVGFGAFFGAIGRWLLGLGLNRLWPLMPLGTLMANMLGGLLIGLLLPLLLHYHANPYLKGFLITGLLGGLTTFSTFSGEVVGMFVEGHYGQAAATAGLHLFGTLSMTLLGLFITKCLILGAPHLLVK